MEGLQLLVAFRRVTKLRANASRHDCFRVGRGRLPRCGDKRDLWRAGGHPPLAGHVGNLRRRKRAEGEGWHGETEGLDLTLSFLRAKRASTQRFTHKTHLGFPAPRHQRL